MNIVMFLPLIPLAIFLRMRSVAKYRLKMLDDIFELSVRDIERGNEYGWRYKEYDKVSMDEMIIKFWRPLDSFWTDRSFLEDKRMSIRASRYN